MAKKMSNWLIITWGLCLITTLGYCETNPTAVRSIGVDFRLAQEEPDPACEKMTIKNKKEELYVEKAPQLSIKDIESAKVVVFKAPGRQEQDKRKSLILKKSVVAYEPQTNIYFKLTEEGRQKLTKLTSANLGRRLAVVINGELVMAPTIIMPITGDTIQVTGAFTKECADGIAQAVNIVVNLKNTN